MYTPSVRGIMCTPSTMGFCVEWGLQCMCTASVMGYVYTIYNGVICTPSVMGLCVHLLKSVNC